MDYLGPQSNSLGFVLAVEKLLGLEAQMPERVTNIRVLLAELHRLTSHLVWLGTHGMEVGAISVLLYCLSEREQLLNINELIAGFRHVPELPPHRRAARGSADAGSTRRSRRSSIGSPADRRLRGSADEEPHLAEAHARGRRRPHREHARSQTGWSARSRAPPACPTTSAGRSRTSTTRPTTSTCRRSTRRRRLRALPGTHRGDAREREDRAARRSTASRRSATGPSDYRASCRRRRTRSTRRWKR